MTLTPHDQAKDRPNLFGPAGLLNAIAFLSAFLLFQIELIVAKILLPFYGGSYLVWGACLVFFQTTLLLGYLFAHVVLQRFGISRYKYPHIILILLPFLVFPGHPLSVHAGSSSIPLVIDVFRQLALLIGPVFFVLATMSIIYQSWLSNSLLRERENPYVLYASSNFGSFLALLSYPFFFEAAFDVDQQLGIWRAGYFLLAGLAIVTLRIVPVVQEKMDLEKTVPPLRKQELAYWLLLGAGGTVMFLAVTHILTIEVAPIPLLWILPLAIYLLSFVLNFKQTPWCPRWIESKLHLTLALGVLIYFLDYQGFFPLVIRLPLYLFILFHLCMFCQRRLIESRPKHHRQLTAFYVVISAGGCLAGMAINWIIPLASTVLIEYLIGLCVIAFAAGLKGQDFELGLRRMLLVGLTMALFIFWPLVFAQFSLWKGAALIVAVFIIFHSLRARPLVIAFNILCLICLSAPLEAVWKQQDIMGKLRNYYGVYKISQKDDVRIMVNGITIHGAQALFPEFKKVPLLYYHPKSPVTQVVTDEGFRLQRVGIIGLGVGAIAASAKPDQEIDFYELDPDVLMLAGRYFTYLKDSRAKTNVILGDARLSLEQRPDKNYDLLIIDAFSGDAIPTHLLTTDAMLEYKRHLGGDGLLMFHTTNKYLDLVPVMLSNAKAVGAFVAGRDDPPGTDNMQFSSQWIVLTWSPENFEQLTGRLRWKNIAGIKNIKVIRPWTDQYSNLLSRIKLGEFVQQLRNFSK